MARRTSLRIMPVGPDQLRKAIDSQQADLGLAATEDVDMGRLVIVDKDDHAQPVGTQHSDR